MSKLRSVPGPVPASWGLHHFSVKQSSRYPASPTRFSTSLSRTLSYLGGGGGGRVPKVPLPFLFHRSRTSQACGCLAKDYISQSPLQSRTCRRGTQILGNLIRPRQIHLLTRKKCHLPRLLAPQPPWKESEAESRQCPVHRVDRHTPGELLVNEQDE